MLTIASLQAAVADAQDKPGADRINAAWARATNALVNVEKVLAETAERNDADERKATLRDQAKVLEAQLAAVKAELRPAKATDAPVTPEVNTIDAIREWAIAQGMTVSKRGRLAATVIDAYRDAHDERELISA